MLQGTTFRPSCPSHFQVSNRKRKENANLFKPSGTLSRTIWKVWCVVASELWERHVRCRCRCLCIKPRSPMYSAISLWNSLPNNFRTINARTTFHSALKEHFCWVYVHPLIYPHTFSLYQYPVPYQTDVPASSTFIQAFTSPPPPHPHPLSPSLLDTSFSSHPLH